MIGGGYSACSTRFGYNCLVPVCLQEVGIKVNSRKVLGAVLKNAGVPARAQACQMNSWLRSDREVEVVSMTKQATSCCEKSGRPRIEPFHK